MKKFIATVFALTPSLAFAHAGHIDHFFAAFAHPFTGVDHLLMMLCIGIFAGRVGGNARWHLPLAFLCAMTAGWIIAALGYSPDVEGGIAVGLIALGAMFVLKMNIARTAQLSIIAMFAGLHGMAHGGELSNATPFATGIGMLLATGLLHGLGLGSAALLTRARIDIYREMGALIAVFGGALLMTA